MEASYNLIPAEELGKNTTIGLEVCECEQDLYWRMALEVFDLVRENNAAGKKTVMIVPYGPVGPYSRLAYLVNKYQVSLKNCYFVNMDEYLNDDLTYIDYDHPFSFRGGMDRMFYDLVQPELRMPASQRIFPEPGNEARVQQFIDENGGLDMCWGGVGITGHVAFNEPPEPGEEMANEDFLALPTRVLRIARETKTINAYMNCGADLDGIPDNCITVGMKEIFSAQRVRLCMPRDWNCAMLRKILHGPITSKVPCSLLRNHPDTKIYAAAVALQAPARAI
ncbi:MAG: hypothetical protein RR482_07660, partial [Clostridia bacterium]